MGDFSATFTMAQYAHRFQKGKQLQYQSGYQLYQKEEEYNHVRRTNHDQQSPLQLSWVFLHLASVAEPVMNPDHIETA